MSDEIDQWNPPGTALSIAWAAFCESERGTDDYRVAVEDAVVSAAPLIVAVELRRLRDHLRARADELDPEGASMTTVTIDEPDIPAFRRMLLLLKVQFDSGEIQRVPDSTNGVAADLLYRMCEQFGVR